jgi:hypothetical protein
MSEQPTDASKPTEAAKAIANLPVVRTRTPRVSRKHAAAAIAAAIALPLGWAGGSQLLSGVAQKPQAVPGWTEAMAGIRQSQESISRLASDVNALTGVVAALKDSVERAKVDAVAQNRPLLERLDRLEQTGRDAAARMARGTDPADGAERAAAAPDAKFAALASRPDAVERPTVDPIRTGSVPETKAAAKPKPVEGWVLREVYDGGALVESRTGRLYEVAPGRNLPSVGRVETIERRGRIWVVVTAKGVIAPPARWR